MDEDKERDAKQARTVAYNPPLEFIGTKGLVKKSEFVRVITDALYSLGSGDIAATVEEKFGIPLHSPEVKQFLKLVKDGEWDQCIEALKGFGLRDEKAAKFLLLEEKFFTLFKAGDDAGCLRVLTEEMTPLKFDIDRVSELLYKLVPPPGQEDTESVNSRPDFAKKLLDLFPPAVLFPEKRLECLVENYLESQLLDCTKYNVPDSDLSILSNHDCGDHKIPSETIQILKGHTNGVKFLRFSHNGRYLASASKDESAIIWEMDAEGKFSLKHKLEGHKSPVVEVLWRPDDQQVLTCGKNDTIRSWDVESGAFVRSYEICGVDSVSCGWFPDGSGIIGGMEDKRIHMWRLDGTEIEQEQAQRTYTLSDVAMTSNGKFLVSVVGRDQNVISFFDRETNRIGKIIAEKDNITTYPLWKDKITSFSLSKDNKFILISLSSRRVHIWDIQGEPKKVLGFDGIGRRFYSWFIIRSCFGGYKEAFVASGGEEFKVYIWHRSDGTKPCRVLGGYAGALNCVSWNPMDMNMLASASDDGTIRIWGIDKNLK